MTNFKAAILIIGSLFWDPDREKWREERLQVERAIPVPSPIRYGRISRSRCCTYTMVFSNELSELVPPRLGWALAVPCKSEMSTACELIEEAEELWAAERLEPRSSCISTDWGAVGLLLNPERPGLDEIKAGWLRRVKKEPQNYEGFKKGANEREPAVDQEGMLSIDWPNPESGDLLDVDLLLAIATQPSLNNDCCYATPQEIAVAWNEAPKEKQEYFYKNRCVGITTADDDCIKRYLVQEDA